MHFFNYTFYLINFEYSRKLWIITNSYWNNRQLFNLNGTFNILSFKGHFKNHTCSIGAVTYCQYVLFIFLNKNLFDNQNYDSHPLFHVEQQLNKMPLSNAFMLLHKCQRRGNNNLLYNFLLKGKINAEIIPSCLFPKQETLILWQPLIRVPSLPLWCQMIDTSQAETFCPVGTIGV